MDKPFYEFIILDEAYRFEFVSSGKRDIEKVIIFESTNLPGYFNLVLSDLLPNGTINVLNESKNGDMEKIMATVIQTVLAFLSFHPDNKVFFSGSTLSRTRLYNIIISKELKNIKDIEILGLKNDELLPFEWNENYEGFVIYKKKL